MINMVLISELREAMTYFFYFCRNEWAKLYNDLKGGKAQALVTNLLVCDRPYTSHLFAGDGLALD